MNATVSAARMAPSTAPRSGCTQCGFAAWALPARLTPAESRHFDAQIIHCRRMRRNEYVHRAGATLVALNVINSGVVKSSVTGLEGHVQGMGFAMRGEMIGLDAIGAGIHQCDTVALEDTHLCGIEFASFERLMHDITSLQHRFNQTLGAEITRDHEVMFQMGAMCADERVAIFLLNLSKRLAVRGYSAVQFRLPMQRQEIANYLGLKLETVSRSFGKLHAEHVICVDGKDIHIENAAELNRRTSHYNQRQPA